MRKKLIIILIISIMLVNGCSKENNDILNVSEEIEQTYITSTYITEEMKDAPKAGPIVEFISMVTHESVLEEADAVVIASIISLEGANTDYNSAIGNTYGKMVINNTIYGNLEEKSVVPYIKDGGVMSYHEYMKNDPSSELHEKEWKENGIDSLKTYIRVDYYEYPTPILEEGKTYLCYLKYIEAIDKYYIIGLNKGFYEINIPKQLKVSSKKIDLTKYQVLNNETDEYELLIDFISKYINK